MDRKTRILVVDDSPDDVNFIKTVLEQEGYEILSAGDGQEGMTKIRQIKPDAIVLDIMMPVKNGFDTCKELKADEKLAKIPVLILTAVGDHLTQTEYTKAQGLELESEDYITKPISPEVLKTRLKEVLQRN